MQWVNYLARGGGLVDPCRREALRAEVGFPTADQRFSSIQGTLFSFYGIWIVFDAWILPSTVVEPSKKVPDLNCDVQDPLLEVDLEEEVPDLRSDGIPPI